jgi:hypothetical protein
MGGRGGKRRFGRRGGLRRIRRRRGSGAFELSLCIRAATIMERCLAMRTCFRDFVPRTLLIPLHSHRKKYIINATNMQLSKSSIHSHHIDEPPHGI